MYFPLVPHVHVPPLHYLVCTLVICTDYFAHFLLVGEPNFTCVIFHVHLLMFTYSVHILPDKESFDRLSGHTSPFWPKFYKYHHFMTKFVHLWLLWPPLFIYFSLVGSYLHILWLRARTSGDLLCTYTFFWWPILYTNNFLTAYYAHIPPNADLNSMYHLVMIFFAY